MLRISSFDSQTRLTSGKQVIKSCLKFLYRNYRYCARDKFVVCVRVCVCVCRLSPLARSLGWQHHVKVIFNMQTEASASSWMLVTYLPRCRNPYDNSLSDTEFHFAFSGLSRFYQKHSIFHADYNHGQHHGLQTEVWLCRGIQLSPAINSDGAATVCVFPEQYSSSYQPISISITDWPEHNHGQPLFKWKSKTNLEKQLAHVDSSSRSNHFRPSL